MVVVEDHDGGHHGASHHEHDAVEICALKNVITHSFSVIS